MLLARRGDQHLGLRTRDRDWTWDAVVHESAARAALAHRLRAPGPFHIGVLLDNVPDFVFTYVVALTLLVASDVSVWLTLAFPVWVLIVSVLALSKAGLIDLHRDGD